MRSVATKTILVIEDEDALQEAICRKLRARGYNVFHAITAEEGLKILQTTIPRPDLVWLDLLLPGMGGFQLLECMREDETLKNIPVMVASVSAGPEKIQRAFHLNVVEYVVKSEHRLEDIIKKVDGFVAALS